MESLASSARAGARIPIAGTYNLRSAAGYPAVSGAIRPGSLFRSDALHRVDADGARELAAQGIVRIVDLRDDAELGRAPSAVPPALVETVHHPIFAGAAIPQIGAAPSLAEIYRSIATDRVVALTGAVRRIADAPEGGVLVNCTAGKDRTGMVIATTLSVVGVPREQIVADYVASETHLAGEWAEAMLASFTAQHGVAPESVRELVASSPAALIAEALDLIEELHGGAERMLLAHGFDAAALARLRDRLVG
ncbi:tyrosine-protein phosphatase [Leucobacter allii]|uniref:Tyrosine-protein phosphatase n=1 Tax=Leucobacter allii TaxID=2932247 RepID=A0ABY4FIW8_9MICO|nr:tyrosine-protein phosphatase [Leucobacter allii]UOQ56635.1 tyrosine-protein phosphatase [Leucobacter allii]